MLRSLLSPLALLSHVLVLSVAVTCVLLGQWQFDRLDQVRASNALLADRLAAPEVPLAELADAQTPGSVDTEALTFRQVSAVGTYRVDEEVLQRNQQLRGQTGFHVLTPLELADGGVILVLRGWVPPQLDTPRAPETAPPTGEVTISGVLVPSVDQPPRGARDADDGVLERVFHADTSRLDRQIDGALFPMVLRIDTEPSEVAFDVLPVPVGSPVLDEGNHLSYAVQWHIFAALAVITYGAWLWSRRPRPPRGGTPTDAPPAAPQRLSA